MIPELTQKKHTDKGVFAKMIKTNSGQAAGIFLPFWSPMLPERFCTQGFLHLARKTLEVNRNVRRIIISAGTPADSRGRKMCIDFLGEDVDTLYLPEYFLFDVTLDTGKKLNTLTFVQAAKREGGKNVISRSAYVGVSKKSEISMDDFRAISAELLMEELWHKLIGVVKPGWGAMYHDGFYLSEHSFHIGILGNEPLPYAWDMKDLGRLEAILEKEECFSMPEMPDILSVRKKLAMFCSPETENPEDETAPDPFTVAISKILEGKGGNSTDGYLG